MRLLVIGHTYLTAYAQQKYVEMKRQCESLELRILTPRSVCHVFKRYEREYAPELVGGEMPDIREYFGRSHMTYVLDPVRFARILREFRPHRIHIEEDPHSMVGAESVLLARRVCPSARISFFIWDNLARSPRFPLNLVKRALNRYALSRADLVVCGNREGEILLREKKGYAGRTAVLPQLGLNPEAYAGNGVGKIRAALSVPPEVPLIGFVGRLIPEKGLSLLFEALQGLMHLPWRLLVLGSGPLEGEVDGVWRQAFGERLIFRKAVPHVEVSQYMRSMDLFVLPSYATPEWKEQFGLVLAEAMMAGVPCIGSSSGAIPDVIGPGGVIFKEKDRDDLARALQRLLAAPDLRKSLGDEAQRFALRNYTHAAVAASYLREFGSA